MTLPPPREDGTGPWRDHQIATPAFRLGPIEKPDMSPFLVHMTNKEAIFGILETGAEGQGTIKSAPPSQSRSWYREPVVCFTESPFFAIDAFRYISFPRWQQDLRYGLGFSKERLASNGVRPALYCDRELVRLFKRLKDLTDPASDQPDATDDISLTVGGAVVARAVPLMTALLEDQAKQGFTWEREWRHTGGDRKSVV